MAELELNKPFVSRHTLNIWNVEKRGLIFPIVYQPCKILICHDVVYYEEQPNFSTCGFFFSRNRMP